MTLRIRDGDATIKLLKTLVFSDGEHAQAHAWVNAAGETVEPALVAAPFGDALAGAVRYAFANVAASQTDIVPTRVEEGTALPAAPTGLRYYVLGLILTNNGSGKGTVTLNSKGGGAGTAIGPPLTTAADGGGTAFSSYWGLTRTKLAEQLTVTTNAGQAGFGNVGMMFAYVAAA